MTKRTCYYRLGNVLWNTYIAFEGCKNWLNSGRQEKFSKKAGRLTKQSRNKDPCNCCKRRNSTSTADQPNTPPHLTSGNYPAVLGWRFVRVVNRSTKVLKHYASKPGDHLGNLPAHLATVTSLNLWHWCLYVTLPVSRSSIANSWRRRSSRLIQCGRLLQRWLACWRRGKRASR